MFVPVIAMEIKLERVLNLETPIMYKPFKGPSRNTVDPG